MVIPTMYTPPIEIVHFEKITNVGSVIIIFIKIVTLTINKQTDAHNKKTNVDNLIIGNIAVFFLI